MATKTKNGGQAAIYQMVTDMIVNALEEGTVPWRKPWKAAGLHRNFNSKRPYRGVNQFVLDYVAQINGYESPYWITYKKIQEAGAELKQLPDAEKGSGQKTTPVVFYKLNKFKTGEKDSDGNDIEKVVPYLRFFRVFNTDQVEGLEVPKFEAVTFDPIESAQSIVDNMPNRPKLSHGGDRAFYMPAADSVRLPNPEDFDKPEEYYSTAFHELVHSTGHESRLHRVKDWKGFGSDPYAREELVAEMGAAMLCGIAGIENTTLDNSAAYIKSWLGKIKEDSKLVVQAASKAQAASDYIMDVKFNNHDEDDK